MTILESLLQVTIAGLVLGAGLPILFGVGIRLWVPSSDGATGGPGQPANVAPWRRTAAVVIFGIIALSILVGLLWITQGRIYSAFGWDVFGTAGQAGGH
ncbi:Putative membrane protein [Corynebacterium glyciniphilum AJ 3170]|uniref:Putative membrane protein n=1 Tax=Corynebacterium glyciniphilum AJ 3170 TaxID=1404245 RepID=X5E6P0_9CORY|nr:hypothetical protein [Corynebacterium glyciniphilum]AHW63115.1 Putative membrane protein [Corynebacterium glyciniphilum AJ 3170]